MKKNYGHYLKFDKEDHYCVDLAKFNGLDERLAPYPDLFKLFTQIIVGDKEYWVKDGKYVYQRGNILGDVMDEFLQVALTEKELQDIISMYSDMTRKEWRTIPGGKVQLGSFIF